MKQYLRYLRVAWTIGWGAAAMLLLALWTRSYLAREDLTFIAPSKMLTSVSSDYGSMGISHYPVFAATTGWTYVVKKPSHEYRGFQESPTPGGKSFWIPFWFPVALSTALAVIPWLRTVSWRFRVRNLLIMATLLAALLGLFDYLKR